MWYIICILHSKTHLIWMSYHVICFYKHILNLNRFDNFLFILSQVRFRLLTQKNNDWQWKKVQYVKHLHQFPPLIFHAISLLYFLRVSSGFCLPKLLTHLICLPNLDLGILSVVCAWMWCKNVKREDAACLPFEMVKIKPLYNFTLWSLITKPKFC